MAVSGEDMSGRVIDRERIRIDLDVDSSCHHRRGIRKSRARKENGEQSRGAGTREGNIEDGKHASLLYWRVGGERGV